MGKERLGSAELGFIWERTGKALYILQACTCVLGEQLWVHSESGGVKAQVCAAVFGARHNDSEVFSSQRL